MKLTKRQLKKLINSAIHESSEDPRSRAMDAALASIRQKFGADAIIDSGAGEKLSADWMNFVMRQPVKYTDTLLHIWDHLIDGDNPASTRDIYYNDLDKDHNIAGAITFYGRKIRKDQQYLTGDQLREKIEARREASRAKSTEAAAQRDAQRSAQDQRLTGASLDTLRSQRDSLLASLDNISSDKSTPYGMYRGDKLNVDTYQKPDGSAFTQEEMQILQDHDRLDAQSSENPALAGYYTSRLQSPTQLKITFKKHTAG